MAACASDLAWNSAFAELDDSSAARPVHRTMAPQPSCVLEEASAARNHQASDVCSSSAASASAARNKQMMQWEQVRRHARGAQRSGEDVQKEAKGYHNMMRKCYTMAEQVCSSHSLCALILHECFGL